MCPALSLNTPWEATTVSATVGKATWLFLLKAFLQWHNQTADKLACFWSVRFSGRIMQGRHQTLCTNKNNKGVTCTDFVIQVIPKLHWDRCKKRFNRCNIMNMNTCVVLPWLYKAFKIHYLTSQGALDMQYTSWVEHCTVWD